MNKYTGYLDTQDLGFIHNQYGMFPYPTLDNNVAANGQRVDANEALEAFFHTEKNGAPPSEGMNKYNAPYKRYEGIFFDKRMYALRGNDHRIQEFEDTPAMEGEYKINANGKAYISAIHKKGKFPFIVNRGNGHFTSFVLHKKPGVDKDTPWKVAVADSVHSNAKSDTFTFENQTLTDVKLSDDIYDNFITTLNQSAFFKEHFGTIGSQKAEHAPCLPQTDDNCLLNTYINCRSSTVDKNGNILFPGIGNHAIKDNTVNTEIQKLRELANQYGGYYKIGSTWHGAGCGAPNNRGRDVVAEVKENIAKGWQKYENQQKFQRVLTKLLEYNKSEWKLTREQIKGIFDEAEKDRYYSNQETEYNNGTLIKKWVKDVTSSAFSAMFQEIAAQEGLFTLNKSSNVNLTVGMRTKWVNKFARNNDIHNIDKALQDAGFAR